VVFFLLTVPDVQVNVLVGPHKSTPLHGMVVIVALTLLAAGFAGHEIITALLLAVGADSNICNAMGLTAHQDMQGELRLCYLTWTGDARNAYKVFVSGGAPALQKHYSQVKKLMKMLSSHKASRPKTVNIGGFLSSSKKVQLL
jgi:hypothetical protein